MSYKINFTDTSVSPNGITVQDQSLNNSDTSLVFVGKNFPNYSQYIGENFLHLLENFSNRAPPAAPIKGQLWYDDGNLSVPPRPQLKVYDGTNWAEAGSVKKGIVRPSSDRSIVGDLWVDSNNQQLYLFTGTTWVLVGPQFNETASTGYKAEEIIDRSTNTSKLVISFYIEDTRILILSKYEFVPKLSIEGFPIIKQGLNLSNADFDLDGVFNNKFWGTSEKANSLIVSNVVVPAANFLRNDVASTTNFPINIRNGSGVNLGPSLETSITSSSSGTILHQTNPNSPIFLRTTPSVNSFNDVVTITADGKVGVNRTNPTEALHVNGNVLVDSRINVKSTLSSTSITTGALVVDGGVGIAKSVNIGETATINGMLRVGTGITPTATNSYDIGITSNRFRNIYTKNIEADSIKAATFEGFLTGNISGAASKLSTLSSFAISGDVASDTLLFNGTTLTSVKNISKIKREPDFLSPLIPTKTIVTVTTTADHNFTTGYIATISCSTNNTFNTTAPITVTSSTTFTYIQDKTLSSVSESSAAGTVAVNPGGTFVTQLTSEVISNKTLFDTSFNNDEFLIYRPINAGTLSPTLGKIRRSTLLGGLGTVPVGAIFPYVGDVAPSGYLLCDGSEQSRSRYSVLFSTIGFKYKSEIQLIGFQTFALPDLRGRFPAGIETMDNNTTASKEIIAVGTMREKVFVGDIYVKFIVSNAAKETSPSLYTVNGPFQVGKAILGTGLAGAAKIFTVQNNTPNSGQTTITVEVTGQPVELPAVSNLILTQLGTFDTGGGIVTPSRLPGASNLGNVGGSSRLTLGVNQIPEHTHDLQDSVGNQYYAINSDVGPPPESNVSNGDIRFGAGTGHLLKNSGGITTSGSLGQMIDISNPYLTTNYIIYSGLPSGS